MDQSLSSETNSRVFLQRAQKRDCLSWYPTIHHHIHFIPSQPLAKGIRSTSSLPGALAARFKVMQHLGILSCNNLVNQAIENLQKKTKFSTVHTV